MPESENFELFRRSIAEALARQAFLDRQLIDPATEAIIDEVRRNLGGERLSIAKHVPSERIRQEVRAEFDGHNRQSLCQKFGISQATFYRMIK